MDYLLDTNAVSDFMREHPKLIARAGQKTPADRIILCPIVRGEIMYGIRRLPPGRRREELETKATRLFAAAASESVPAEAGDKYANVKIDRQRHGLSLDENDLWIAATALALGATLVTRDSDFSSVAGLQVEDWTA